jgi:D-tyrosyl-tRNA(Tyr) deacylase
LIGLLQRVSEAGVSVENRTIGSIGPGLAVLIAVERGDGPPQARRLAERLLAYRVFPDADGRINRSLADTGGGLLLVPQFTLAADTDSGNRPSFSKSAPPAAARALFEALVEACRQAGVEPAVGEFGAHMRLGLVNDGPVTFLLRVAPDLATDL